MYRINMARLCDESLTAAQIGEKGETIAATPWLASKAATRGISRGV